MRQKFFATVVVFTFLVTASLPFMGLNAAELWNKQSDKATEAKKYYNAPKNSVKKRSLYNTQQTQGNKAQGVIGRVENNSIGKIQKVSIGKQVTSKLFSIMSESAVENRTSDVQNALQVAYEQKKENVKALAKMRLENARLIKKRKLEHKKRVAQYYADKKAGKKKTVKQAMKDSKVYPNSISKPQTNSLKAQPTDQTSTLQQKRLYNTFE